MKQAASKHRSIVKSLKSSFRRLDDLCVVANKADEEGFENVCTKKQKVAYWRTSGLLLKSLGQQLGREQDRLLVARAQCLKAISGEISKFKEPTRRIRVAETSSRKCVMRGCEETHLGYGLGSLFEETVDLLHGVMDTLWAQATAVSHAAGDDAKLFQAAWKLDDSAAIVFTCREAILCGVAFCSWMESKEKT